jgi:hypothetical protein
MRPWGEDDVRPTETGYELSDVALDEIMSASFGEDSKMSNKLTLDYLIDWAKQNKVPGNAVICDDDTGEFAIDISHSPAGEHDDEPATLNLSFDDVDE